MELTPTEEVFGKLDAEGRRRRVDRPQEPKPKPHPLESVPFFQRPMSATTKDRQVGFDELGNPEFVTMTGQTYIVRLNPDQRNLNQKIRDAAPLVKKSVTNYLKNPTIPSRHQVLEFGKAIAQGYQESLEGMLKGTASQGEVFTSVIGLGGASTMFKVPEGSLRVFGGKSARIDGNGNGQFKKARLRFREQVQQADISDPETFYNVNKKIWNETGWFINPRDRQWRFEIDDRDAKVDIGNAQVNPELTPAEVISTLEMSGGFTKLPDILDHPELFLRYPHLKDFDVFFYKGEMQELGSFSPSRKQINLNSSTLNLNDPKSVKPTLLHEIQHAIQEYEGFSLGANSDFIPDKLVKEATDRAEALEIKGLDRIYRSSDRLSQSDLDSDLLQSLDEYFPDPEADGALFMLGNDTEIDQALRMVMKDHNIDVTSELGQELSELADGYKILAQSKDISNNLEFKFYRGAGGEIEARLVGARSFKEMPREFPLTAEKKMLKTDEIDEMYEGKMDIEESANIRKPKLGGADVYIDLPKIDNDVMLKSDGGLDIVAFRKAQTDNFQKLLGQHKELKDLANLKRNEIFNYKGRQFRFKDIRATDVQKGLLPESDQIIIGTKESKKGTFKVPSVRAAEIKKFKGEIVENEPINLNLGDILEDLNFDVQKLKQTQNPSLLKRIGKRLGFDEGGLVDTGMRTPEGRIIWNDGNEDYSERTTTFEIDGKYYTMPTVAEDGSQYSTDIMRDYVKQYGPIDFNFTLL